MRLRVGERELEIAKGAFVCFTDGEKTQFCEWNSLDPELQRAFSTIKRILAGTLNTFITSKTKSAFDQVAEEYVDGGCYNHMREAS